MKFKVYRSARGLLRRTQWRWRLRARNGRTIADSGESYSNRSDCLRAIELIRAESTLAPIEVED